MHNNGIQTFLHKVKNVVQVVQICFGVTTIILIAILDHYKKELFQERLLIGFNDRLNEMSVNFLNYNNLEIYLIVVYCLIVLLQVLDTMRVAR